MSRRLRQESSRYCPETCPDVDAAFDNAWTDLAELIAPNNQDAAKALLDGLKGDVKDCGTNKLRDALETCIMDKHAVQDELEEAGARIDELTSELESRYEE